MESTGVYWIPPYELLEEAGFEVLLMNPRLFHAVSGRKTDVKDCQWIQQLHSCRKKKDVIAKALEGNYRKEHLLALKQAYAAYEFFHSLRNWHRHDSLAQRQSVCFLARPMPRKQKIRGQGTQQ